MGNVAHTPGNATAERPPSPKCISTLCVVWWGSRPGCRGLRPRLGGAARASEALAPTSTGEAPVPLRTFASSGKRSETADNSEIHSPEAAGPRCSMVR
jgi:hypothetical protein